MFGLYPIIICFWWFFIGAIVSSTLSSPLERLVYDKEQVEGEFRSSLTTLFQNLEAVLLLKGLELESKKVQHRLSLVNNATSSVIRRHFLINSFAESFSYAGSILNYSIIGFALFYGAEQRLTSGERAALLSKGSFACLYLISGLSSMLSAYLASADILGLSARITEVIIRSAHSFTTTTGIFEDKSSSGLCFASPDPSVVLDLKGLEVLSPSGHQLIQPITLRITRGMRLLIQGPSGCGKSTLLRHLAGLGANSESSVSMMSVPRAVSLPQTPYFFRGTLVENIVYPAMVDEDKYEVVTDLLRRVSLDYLQSIYGLDTVFDAPSVLSPGEKQKLAVCRCIFHAPELVYMHLDIIILCANLYSL